MRKILVILTLFSFCIVALTVATTPASAQSRNISIKGSDTMVILGQRWAETYMKGNPGVTIQVTGGGSESELRPLSTGRRISRKRPAR
jgi:phosphate transport system substrate-binding protein